MRAVVLVGGFGTRLRPLTLGLPKQMLPVVGVTMLERVLGTLAAFGVDDAVLSLGYRPDVFVDAFPDGICAGVEIHYAVEPEPLDTAGAIKFAAQHAGIVDRFLAVNGDVLSDVDVSELWARHDKTGAEATIALTPVEDPSRYGVVPLHPDGRVEAFIEKPEPGAAPSNWINAGTYVLEPSVLSRIPSGRPSSIEREVFPAMVRDGCLYGVHSDAYWIDAGTPEAYLQANLDMLNGRRGDRLEGVHHTARIDPTAKVNDSVVGRGSVVGRDAVVIESVVMDGVRICAGARVQRSLVGPAAVIGEGALVSELSVVGHDVDVMDGTEMVGACVPPPEDWPST